MHITTFILMTKRDLIFNILTLGLVVTLTSQKYLLVYEKEGKKLSFLNHTETKSVLRLKKNWLKENILSRTIMYNLEGSYDIILEEIISYLDGNSLECCLNVSFIH